ncbi:uncharacterized protein HMPREF1541_07100 [Cyphellophora europaea CBS 101466]|uniref:AB hydrolase-1 domain-containing protein n=1 Tax=Cyphellophora europaea (strain CBS 101466) TaxID=1220924 RepID=W2RP68_CYPE1|nr:uncharacterized protein HMPREF1541_07100 [Cyphellophora europaea CBS 101466]ETN37478.1 hypothetical protein HMPREF1541_07100 [Cyphellophora europaea CBS 101466]
MKLTIVCLVALLRATQASASPPPGYQCQDFSVDVAVNNVTTIVPPLPIIETQEQATSYVNELVRRDAPTVQPVFTSLSKTFMVSGEWCAPVEKGLKSSTLQILTHGYGFNRSYWDFRLDPTDAQYSYIDAATTAGYSVLSYNRLGHAPSSIPDPYTELQAPVEVDVLVTLTRMVREGAIPGLAIPDKVIHVGHSYGSALTIGLAEVAPSLSDGLVITGWIQVPDFAGYFLSSTAFTIASDAEPSRFPADTYSKGYVTWPSEAANQFAFFAYPNFEAAALTEAEATKHPLALNEFLSQGLIGAQAPEFEGPVLFLVGERDQIACGYNCTGLIGPGSPAAMTFNATRSFEWQIHPEVGHALNLHKNATAAYDIISEWIGRRT